MRYKIPCHPLFLSGCLYSTYRPCTPEYARRQKGLQLKENNHERWSICLLMNKAVENWPAFVVWANKPWRVTRLKCSCGSDFRRFSCFAALNFFLSHFFNFFLETPPTAICLRQAWAEPQPGCRQYDGGLWWKSELCQIQLCNGPQLFTFDKSEIYLYNRRWWRCVHLSASPINTQ